MNSPLLNAIAEMPSSVLKELYWWLDMYNDSFAREMGWV